MMDNMQSGFMGFATKVIGIGLGIFVFIIGIFTMISFSAKCIFAGLFMIFTSIIIIFIEAPYCCTMFPTLQRFEKYVQFMDHLKRGILYFVAGLIPLILCFGISLFFGCLSLFLCSAFHIWQFVKNRRAGGGGSGGQGFHTAEEGGAMGGGGEVIGSTNPPPYSQVTPGDAFNDPYMQKVAMGAAKGAVSAGMNQPQPPAPGGYPGF